MPYSLRTERTFQNYIYIYIERERERKRVYLLKDLFKNHIYIYIEREREKERESLVWFYDISIILGNLRPNLVFTYILNILFVNTFCRYTPLNDKIVLFQAT